MSLALLAGVEVEGSYLSLALLAAWSTRVDWGGGGGFLYESCSSRRVLIRV